MSIDRRKQNIGYPWQTDGQRRNINTPVALIPLLKKIAYKLDSVGVADDSKIEIIENENEIIIKIVKT